MMKGLPMSINARLMAGLLAAAIGAAAIQTPAASTPARPETAARQCQREAPAQFGPRAPLPGAQRTCAPVREACGRYELYWPHWLSERGLPPVRRWVAEPC